MKEWIIPSAVVVLLAVVGIYEYKQRMKPKAGSGTLQAQPSPDVSPLPDQLPYDVNANYLEQLAPAPPVPVGPTPSTLNVGQFPQQTGINSGVTVSPDSTGVSFAY
jgi:hypothetical protein